jgi:hypothetical protein
MIKKIPASKGCLHSNERLTLIFGRHANVLEVFLPSGYITNGNIEIDSDDERNPKYWLFDIGDFMCIIETEQTPPV